MMKVKESNKAIKNIKKLPKNIRATYLYWRNQVEISGIAKLREIKSFHFEKLKGNRQGQNSCRLSKEYRVIFKILKKEIIVEVLEVNKHDY